MWKSILHVLLVTGFGAGKLRQLGENSQLRGIWENPVFPNAALAPSLGLPVLVFHELHNWICRQNSDIPMDREQISNVFSSIWISYGKLTGLPNFSIHCIHGWQRNFKIINCFSWHWIHPWFPTSAQTDAHSQSNLLLIPALGYWAAVFGQALHKLMAALQRNTGATSCSKSHLSFPGGVQYKSASALNSCDRIYSVFKAWLCLSTNHPLSEEPGSLLLETLNAS